MLVVIWRDQSTGYATLSTALHTQELSLTLGETPSGESGSYSLQVRRSCVSGSGGDDDTEPLVSGFDEDGFHVSWSDSAQIGVRVTLRLKPLQEGGDPDVLTFHAVNRTAAVTR